MKQKMKKFTSIGAYIALILLIIFGTFVLVLIGKGYVFDWRRAKLTSGGLVLVKSEPADTQIYIDNKSKGNSPKRIPLKAGRYQMKLIKAGYRDWQKSIAVDPSTVSWQQYPFLIPDNLSANTLFPLDNPTALTQSANAKHIAWAQNGTQPRVDVLEVTKTEPKTIFRLPPELLAAGVKISTLTWARDNEHILVRSEGAGQLHYFVININAETEIFDLTKEFGLPIDNLSFSFGNWQELYWLSPGGLRRLELNSKTVSAVLADNVSSFTTTPDAVLLIRLNGTQNELQRLEKDGRTSVLLKKLPLEDFGLGYVDYGGKKSVVLHNKTTKRIGLYESDTQANAKYRVYRTIEANDFTLSKDNRYLTINGGKNFATIDFEFSKLYRFSLDGAPVRNITWFDRYHLLASVNNSTIMFEFDGGNPEILINSYEGSPAFGADSQKLLYTIGVSPSTNQLVLQSTQMKR